MKRTPVVVALVVAVAGVVSLLAWKRAPRSTTVGDRAPVAGDPSWAPTGAHLPALAVTPPPEGSGAGEEQGWSPPMGVRDPNWGQHNPVIEDGLEAYLAFAIYPPDSRPLGVQNDDLLNPNKRYEDLVASEDGQVQFRFSADKFFVVAGEPLSSFLEVRRDGALVPVEITASFAAILEPGKLLAELERIPLRYTPSDGMYVNTFVPGEREELRATAVVGMYVEFDHGGETRERASFTIQVTPTRAVPARFTGDFRDHIDDGSLIIEAGLEVIEAGYYLIDANIYDDEGFPVAWTRFKGDLDAGRREVPLSYFGKVLVDSRATPPFHLGQLRGMRFVEARDPDMDVIPPFDGEYVTRRYSIDEFSNAEWDTPQKRDQIERLIEHQRPL